MAKTANFIKVEVFVKVYWEWEFVASVIDKNGKIEKYCDVIMGTCYKNVKATLLRDVKKDKKQIVNIESVKIVGIGYGKYWFDNNSNVPRQILWLIPHPAIPEKL